MASNSALAIAAAVAPIGDDIAVGWGVGLGTHHVSYGAAVAQIEVNRRTGNIVAKRLFGALDAGLTVNPALNARGQSQRQRTCVVRFLDQGPKPSFNA